MATSVSLSSIIDEVMAAPPARGRKPKPLAVTVKRELSEADVQTLWDLPEGGLESGVRPLVKLRYQHHYLARLLAEGQSEQVCHIHTGYDPNRISVLKRDPAFAELVEYYKGQVEQVYISVHERLAALGINTIEELQDRLETDPGKFTNRELMELSELTLDRAGFNPTTKIQHNTTLSVSPDVLQRLKDELAKRSGGEVRPLTSSSARSGGGGLLIEGTVASESPPEGSEGEGPGV